MTKRDSEKESERPHYYSQFWLDIAAGRREIGTPNGASSESKLEEGLDLADLEPMEPVLTHRAVRNASDDTDGYQDTRSQATVEPEVAPEEEVIEPAVEEFALDNEVDDLELPNILVDESADDLESAVPEIDIVPKADVVIEPEAELDDTEDSLEEPEEELFEGEEEEEEDEWNIGRGRKKPKPGRQVKPPKKPKREPRRGF